MSAIALVTGILFRAPEQRTSKAGKPFVSAIVRVKDGDLRRAQGRLANGGRCLPSLKASKLN
jgi:hypothetical protein